jgi:dipeptidyl aminopeptidase/acylaminoacyl peptidase
MQVSRRNRRIILGLCLYLAFSAVLGIFVADGALHPERRPLSDDEIATARRSVQALNAGMEDASITAPDGVTLRAWLIHPQHDNGNAVITLHGLGDNRIGMMGYAQLLVAHGFTVLMPDARAHSASGGELATYGLIERNDIRGWFDFLQAMEHPACIFGFGESMGAAQLLQSLDAGTHFCAVAAESSFADFREVAYDRMGQPFHLGPWIGRTVLRPLVEFAFLRARWKYRLDMNQVSPVAAVAADATPVLLIHGQADGNIPVRHSHMIHSRNPATEFWEVPGADHCGAISTAPEEFERRLLGWYGAHTTVHFARSP